MVVMLQSLMVWAQDHLLHAKCSTKWPHENIFRILSKDFMGEVPNLYNTPLWPWFPKWSQFAEIQKGEDLVSVYLLLLWQIILNDRERIRLSDQHESCSLECAL